MKAIQAGNDPKKPATRIAFHYFLGDNIKPEHKPLPTLETAS
jgi:hypothetical protein